MGFPNDKLPCSVRRQNTDPVVSVHEKHEAKEKHKSGVSWLLYYLKHTDTNTGVTVWNKMEDLVQSVSKDLEGENIMLF
jgi:hypothetical protein